MALSEQVRECLVQRLVLTHRFDTEIPFPTVGDIDFKRNGKMHAHACVTFSV